MTDALSTTDTPALIVAGTHSGSGKTTVTLALLAALTRRGLRVQAFKVGPDFIDPGHHSRLTGRPGRNVDTWMQGPEALARTYQRGCAGADLAVVEGVMGLFDGRGALDEAGSTADLARVWDLPVVLVVDARGLARSVAPLVHGFATYDPRVRIAGVIANRVGSERHYARFLAPALRTLPSAPSPLGYLTRDDQIAIPSRHLGLLTAEEFEPGGRFVERLADAAEATLDLDRLIGLAMPPRLPPGPATVDRPPPARRSVRVALARDPAFCFYYEDNLDLLRDAGAEIVPFSPLADPALPAGTELLYLGGGYPESFAARIAGNHAFRAAVRSYHDQGGAIFAECGGLMACAEALTDHSGACHSLWGLIPAHVRMQQRFKALGYVTVRTEQPTYLGPPGTILRGHEFHYSSLEPRSPLPYATVLLGHDCEPRPDGIRIGGLLAGYAHLHFGSNPDVVAALLR
ncbi:MAG: cobyrinate a,c-diamide synthase [Isosphaeraceae bacterium]|nr:cobyrinate a,c-diamide synthase [Isosphaeraceae bacterium]